MTVLGALIDVEHLVSSAGYPLLFLIVMSESAGVPVPGETALIAAAVLASQGKLQIELVIAVAALAAIVGDNIGYTIGRKGGRWLLERPGAFGRQRHEVLRVGEPFFEVHGGKAVFFGRFLLGLRTWASWLAGATRMRWGTFAIWNALGGVCWATAIGLVAYFIGSSAGNVVEAFGLYGVAVVLIAILSAFFVHRRHRARASAHRERAAGASKTAGTSADAEPPSGRAAPEG